MCGVLEMEKTTSSTIHRRDINYRVLVFRRNVKNAMKRLTVFL